MSVYYQCIICQHANVSIMDLHNHHIQQHNPKELSQTIISLKGFKIYDNDLAHVNQKYLRPINLGDNNNNNNNNNNHNDVYNHMFIKSKLQNINTYKNEQVTNSSRRSSHDKRTCSENCSQFIAWEHELNKRTEINDEDFFNITESLCCDLNKRKRRGRKKKDRSQENKIDIESSVQTTKIENMEMEKTSVDSLNIQATQQAGTITFWDDQHNITNTSDEGLAMQTKHKIENTETSEAENVASTKAEETNRNIIACDTLYNNFSWSSIISEHIDQHDMSVDDGNIYTKSMEPTIENLLS